MLILLVFLILIVLLLGSRFVNGLLRGILQGLAILVLLFIAVLLMSWLTGMSTGKVMLCAFVGAILLAIAAEADRTRHLP